MTRSIRTAVLAPLIASAAWIGWRTSDAFLPPLARDIRGSGRGSAVFHGRVVQAYPAANSETRLLADLRRHGFAIERGSGLSHARITRLIGCGNLLRLVNWRAESGRLTSITGVYGADCL